MGIWLGLVQCLLSFSSFSASWSFKITNHLFQYEVVLRRLCQMYRDLFNKYLTIYVKRVLELIGETR